MEAPEELRKWVETLTIAEKRFVKILGKARSGAKDSQQLELFDWINKTLPAEIIPDDTGWAKNLATVSNRLRDLIFDSLRLLNKTADTDAVLRTMLDEISILISKKQFAPAMRHIRRAKSIANDRSRYDFLLQYLEFEQKILVITMNGDAREALSRLRTEETEAISRLADLRDLRYRHECLLSLTKLSPYHRDRETLKQVDALSLDKLVVRSAETGPYIEKTLASNLLGIRDLYMRNPMPALLRYQKLLREWQSRPDWQTDQVSLLLLICKFYQSACFFCPVDWDVAKEYITMVNHFKGLPPDAERDFQRILYHNQLALSLNSGNFELTHSLITEINEWISLEQDHLAEAQQLSFLCNFAVAEFLSDNFPAANNFIIRIINMPGKNIRKDIRDFACVLQAVLHYEMGDTGLNEYITRSGKRRFSNASVEIKFETLVFNNLQRLLLNKQPREEVFEAFDKEVECFIKTAEDEIPILGLKEIQLWIQSKKERKTIKEIFLTEVKRNLELLDQTEKIA
jgi:hypothetical protein